MSNESSQKRPPKPPFWWAMGPVDLPPRRPNDDLFKPPHPRPPFWWAMRNNALRSPSYVEYPHPVRAKTTPPKSPKPTKQVKSPRTPRKPALIKKPKGKRVTFGGKEYESISQAARDQGMSATHMSRLIRKGPQRVRDHLMNVEYPSLHNAAKAHGMKVREFQRYMKMFPGHYEIRSHQKKNQPNNQSLNWTHAVTAANTATASKSHDAFESWIDRQLYQLHG